MKKIAMGILAHVDSGKTTLSEALLYESGNIKKLGRVDHKDTVLDNFQLEKDRGITIFSKQAVLTLPNTQIYLLDTPGHVDFSTETERTLKAADYGILVISGADGVQNHTKTLWEILEKNRIPVFIFVNKTDSPLFEKEKILAELKDRLHTHITDFTQVNFDFYEQAASCSEKLMEEFFENEKLSDKSISNAVKNREIFPCCFGSALKLNGIKEFLEILDKYTLAQKEKTEFSAEVFKITHDDSNRLSHLKINGGELKLKDLISYTDKDGNITEEKINQIRIYQGGKFKQAENAVQGMVCAVAGLSKTYCGQILGESDERTDDMINPVLKYSLVINDGTNPHIAYEKLKILEEEECKLHISWNESNNCISMEVMGALQLEIIKSLVMSRFGIDISFGNEDILYKETIENTVEGVGHYEPLRHYSEVHLILEPLPRGSGMVFNSDCSEDILGKNWQRLIMTHLQEKTHLGVLTGSPVTDIKITLASGKSHPKHTEGGDFRQATYRAVRQGLMQAKSVLLEPYYDFTLELPTDNVGRAMMDLERMNSTVMPPEFKDDCAVITGFAPVSEIKNYPIELTSYTKGKGKITFLLHGYGVCHNQDKIIEKYNYDPEADLANSPDSVFCSHGTGVLVKWNDIQNHMHLESVLNPKKQEIEIKKETTRKAIENYACALEQDKELMEIFERTYGTIKRDRYYAMKTHKKTELKEYKPSKNIIKLEEYLLVDGYNIIFAWDELKKMSEDNLDGARYTLMNRLCNYQAYKGCNLILVFDAYKVKGNLGSVEKFHNIHVVYTKEKETADSYIERVAHQMRHKYRVKVATSDNLEQIIILGSGALRISAENFHTEVENVEKTIREYLRGDPAVRRVL